MADTIMTRIDRKEYKWLQQMKIDNDLKSISDVIKYLREKDQRDEHEKESMGNIQSDANR